MMHERKQACVPSGEMISSPPRQLASLMEWRAYRLRNTLMEQPRVPLSTASQTPPETQHACFSK
ncbi:hypothetical protein Hanom_Chr04g00349781 [Helianthus anomalus]